MPQAVEYWKALDAEQLAAALIPLHHPHLRGASILYLHTDQVLKSKGKVLLGKTTKPAALAQFLASGLRSVLDGPDFILVFPIDAWQALSDAQRLALVDHELMHAAWVPDADEGGHFTLRGHDL